MTQSFILLSVFLFVTLLIYGTYLVVTAARREIRERMRRFTTKVGDFEEAAGSLKKLQKINWKASFQEASKIFAAKGFAQKMEVELLKADIPLRGEEFILLNVLVMAGFGFLMLLMTGNPILGWIGTVFGYLLPRVLVKRVKNKRVQKFNAQIGDSLTVMSNSLRAGFSFLQAMEMVAREMPAPISEEYARALREMNLGTPTEEALTNMTHRIESEDLDLVMTAVLIQRQVGGNLSEVLDSISFTIRERIRIKGEIKTLTAQGRISGIIVGALPVVIGLVLSVINPSYIGALFTDPIGLVMLVTGVISQVIGIALIKKTVDIKI